MNSLGLKNESVLCFLLLCSLTTSLLYVWPSFKICLLAVIENVHAGSVGRKSKKISNDQELIQSDPTSCPQNQKGNN